MGECNNRPFYDKRHLEACPPRAAGQSQSSLREGARGLAAVGESRGEILLASRARFRHFMHFHENPLHRQ
jgi:hypothetical protein